MTTLLHTTRPQIIRRFAALLLLVIVTAGSAWAQFATAPSPQPFQRGWYLTPTAQATTLNGETAVLTGFRINWAVTPQLMLGLESYSLLNEVAADAPSPDGNTDVHFFYSGLSAEYAFAVTDRLSIAPRALIGGGEAHWRDGVWDGVIQRMDKDDEHQTSLVLEPGLSTHLSLTSWLHVGVEGSYRFVTGGTSRVISQDDMSGFAGTFALRFGRL